MVSDQWIFQAIQAGKSYEQLPKKVQDTLSLNDWRVKVKHYCIQHGYNWSESMANTSSVEQDYYEELLEYYKKNEWLFPYHLSHYICRVLRVTAFRYYSDMLFNSLKEEKAYDKIPNFTAADILRHLGIGRTEYISILDACRAKKFSWRVNRSIAREKLPNEPVSMVMEPWWKLGVVNITESEYRTLSPEDLEFLQTASAGGDNLNIGEVSYELLRGMYKKGLIYLRVVIRDDDKFTIPPLEGFISNRNVSSNGSGVDPMETLLYLVFIANSENMTISSLARVLNADILELKAAMSVAVQLGFATRMSRISDGALSASFHGLHLRENEEEEEEVETEHATDDKYPFASEDSLGEGQALAVLVDAETTSFLMMGLLSSGIKRHAVTLFEGGRVAGDEVISHLITELRASVENVEMDGEIRNLMQTASSLAEVFTCVREASGNRSIELLRKESLQGLSCEAITRVLSHSYKIIVPIAPLSGDPLPLHVSEATPLYFGATDSVASLWFQLTFYEHVASGPQCFIFLRGQRVLQLPAEIKSQQFVLLYTFPFCESPHLVSSPFVLHHLNEMCRYGPVMLQPLFVEYDQSENISKLQDLDFVDVPLPLDVQEQSDILFVKGYHQSRGSMIEISIEQRFLTALATMGLTHALGFVTFSKNAVPSFQYTPLRVYLGIPLTPLESCKTVCSLATERNLFEPSKAKLVLQDLKTRTELVESVLDRFGYTKNCGISPAVNFKFSGSKLMLFEDLVDEKGLDIAAYSLQSQVLASLQS